MSAKIRAPMKVAATKAPEGAKLDRALMKGAKNPPPNIKLKGDLVSAAVMHAFTKLSDEKTVSEQLVTVYEHVRHVVKEMEGVCKEVEDEVQVLKLDRYLKPFEEYIGYATAPIYKMTGWWYHKAIGLNPERADEKAALRALGGDLMVKTGLLTLIVSYGLKAWSELRNRNQGAFRTYDATRSILRCEHLYKLLAHPGSSLGDLPWKYVHNHVEGGLPKTTTKVRAKLISEWKGFLDATKEDTKLLFESIEDAGKFSEAQVYSDDSSDDEYGGYDL